ncbi:MAG TPA: inositol monophosphatase family protein [Xanthomonadaceae bacterium]|nr:inositol monophosphatase family protein [Xanthomonadaceae bacterium]
MPTVPSALHDRVIDILRSAADEAVMPRFRRLREAEVIEKAKDELVTVADRDAEALITRRLLDAWPGSRVVGEEACAADPAVADDLDRGWVWLVDPLDGTANFVAGEPTFALMAALLCDGEAVGSWILDPVNGVSWRAELGAGAFRDSDRVYTTAAARAANELSGAVLTRFLPPDLRTSIEARRTNVAACLPGMRCAGIEYPAIVRDTQQFALFWRTLPWDHVPGALLLTEAGGRVARLDGSPYRASDGHKGLLAAGHPAAWETVREALLS